MRPRTAGELLSELESDPKYVRNQEELAVRQEANRVEFARDAEPVTDELEAAGIDCTYFAVFVKRVIPGVLEPAPFDAEEAAPILLRHLETVGSPRVRGVIISRLKLRSLRGVADEPMLRAFRDEQNDLLRWRIADTLQTVASRDVFDQIVELAGEPRFGGGRAPLVDMLWRVKSPEAERVLERSLTDPTVARAAMSGWKRIRGNADALARFEELTRHPDPGVADAARDYARRANKALRQRADPSR